mmetsp:Transcript_92555/g.244616  ORF Transcript_92555/g.244616 Transcript_92555/m.244616 type:complete len:300 (-) Transcript_92555:164-1063(-)
MRLDGGLEGATRNPVSCHVDNVVGAFQHCDVPVCIQNACVSCGVISLVGLHVGLYIACIVVPQSGKCAWWQRQLGGQRTWHINFGDWLAVCAHNTNLVAGHWEARAAILATYRIILETTNRRSCFGLPPVIENWYAERFGKCFARLGVTPLPSHEQGAERRDVIFADELKMGILFTHRAEPCWGNEESSDLVLLNHAPKGSCIWRAHWLPFIKNSGAALQKWSVYNVGVAYDPTNVRCSPISLARERVHECSHRPLERHSVARSVTDHPFRRPRSPRGVQNVQRVVGTDWHALPARRGC